MPIEALRGIDFSPAEQPEPSLDSRALLEAWLYYQRHEFIRKLRDLTPAQMTLWAVPPVELSVLGLVRHMTQMEHHYLTWGLGGGAEKVFYGEDDYAGGSVDTVEHDLAIYFAEATRSNEVVSQLTGFDVIGLGHGKPLGATLTKMIDEYALHAGQAHMLRFAALGELTR